MSDNLRLDTENDNLARQLVNSKIEMRKEIDEIEDEKDFYEKDLSTTKLQLKEALEEKRRLHVETEQLKALLKRELDKLDAELVTRNNVIAEYKMITSQLSDKLEKAQKGDGAGTKAAPPASDDGSGSKDTLDKANDRIRELELELAQTKLALVETECKNQDLTHQFNATVQNLEQQQQQQSSSKSGTWFSKTLSSIKETTASAATTAGGHMVRSSTSAAVSGGKESLKKSSSIDVLKHAD